MTTITREHLELAARAAGKRLIDGRLAYRDGQLVHVRAIPGLLAYPTWQPHANEADAVQLAEACKMVIDFSAGWLNYEVNGFRTSVRFGLHADNKDTWMQAVTLAAAEIGRAMG